MVSLGTKLVVSDNSGAIRATCIKILGSSYCNSSNIGDTLVVAIQSAKVKKKVVKGQVHKSVLIRRRKKTFRKNGVSIGFTNNSIVLIKPNLDPVGSRIKGSVLQELRYKGFSRILLLATNIL